MNAAETIQAAIDKLEQQKADSTPGPWDFEYTDESIEVNAGSARTEWDAGHNFGIPASSWKTTDRILEADVYELDESEADLIAGNAELIVTLHRTIDAQLDLLRTARGLAGAQITGELAELVVGHGEQLARAILGEVPA